jgi:hypothetical protein
MIPLTKLRSVPVCLEDSHTEDLNCKEQMPQRAWQATRRGWWVVRRKMTKKKKKMRRESARGRSRHGGQQGEACGW